MDTASPTTSTPTPTSFLSPTQRYAAAALFGLSLHDSQINQTRILPLPASDDSISNINRISSSSSSSSDSVSDDPHLWVHHHSGLLRPVFKFLDIDSSAWYGLEETAGSSTATHHVGPFMRLLSQESDDDSAESAQRLEQELALSKAVDAIVLDMKKNLQPSNSKRERINEYEHHCREKYSVPDVQSNSEKVDVDVNLDNQKDTDAAPLINMEDPEQGSDNSKIDERPIEEVLMLSDQRKVTVLYELLSACLSDLREDDKECKRRRKGYDARHRVALRLLATWLDVKWTKMEAIETMVTCSAMAIIKEQESNKEETQGKGSKWAKLKRGGIIGAAAITGGTLLAITGGLAAPAIAAGLGALAPTLGTLIPVIGAGGFAAAAGAAGTVAGSVAVAASFGGTNM